MVEQLSPSQFDVVAFRHQLHRYPERSLEEMRTASFIAQQLAAFGLKPMEKVGGNGVVCIIPGAHPGDTTLIRADFDGLPITEQAGCEYGSQFAGVMHACGHDGHTAALMKVAEQLSLSPPASGSVVLVFQPAEEIGTGAAAMLAESPLKVLQVDHVFAFHNLPGYPAHEVLIKPGTMACASTGVSIEIMGKTSHAAHPEQGINPTRQMLELVQFLESMPIDYPGCFTLVTTISVQLGEPAFGVAPGRAQIMATLRSEDNVVFEDMKSRLLAKVDHIQSSTALNTVVHWHEPFKAAVNSADHVAMIQHQAHGLGLSVTALTEPMRWSEDFAEFLQRWPGALFCVGSGEHHTELHHPDYDFPDELLVTASDLFVALIRHLHG